MTVQDKDQSSGESSGTVRDEGVKMEAEVVDIEREATATVKGFLAQAVHAARRWLILQKDETLICEGTEDIDILSPTQKVMTLEQIKELSTRISARQCAVYETIFHFAQSFIHFANRDHDVLLIFTTCAELAQQKTGRTEKGAELEIDVLGTWRELADTKDDEKTEGLKVACKSLLANAIERELISKDAVAKTKVAFQYLDDNLLWKSFFLAVQWNSCSADLDAALGLLRSETTARFSIGDTLADRILWHVLWVMSRSNLGDRQLTQQGLLKLVDQVRHEAGQWASSLGCARRGRVEGAKNLSQEADSWLST
ncbi:MAG: hypothetical protein ABIO70_28320 [Pseudomonadota bacterium]